MSQFPRYEKWWYRLDGREYEYITPFTNDPIIDKRAKLLEQDKILSKHPEARFYSYSWGLCLNKSPETIKRVSDDPGEDLEKIKEEINIIKSQVNQYG